MHQKFLDIISERFEIPIPLLVRIGHFSITPQKRNHLIGHQRLYSAHCLHFQRIYALDAVQLFISLSYYIFLLDCRSSKQICPFLLSKDESHQRTALVVDSERKNNQRNGGKPKFLSRKTATCSDSYYVKIQFSFRT